MNNVSSADLPRLSVEEIQRLIAGELSLPSRLAYVALLLAGVAGAGVVGALWLTEPALPARAQFAFALLIPINLSWVFYASWVLTRRRVLLAGHRIVAARMAVTFSAVFVAGFLAAGLWAGGGRAAYGAAAFGVAMLVVAVGLLGLARRRFDRLLERRRLLQREMGKDTLTDRP